MFLWYPFYFHLLLDGTAIHQYIYYQINHHRIWYAWTCRTFSCHEICYNTKVDKNKKNILRNNWPISMYNGRIVRIILERLYREIGAKMGIYVKGNEVCSISYTGRTSALFDSFTIRCHCSISIFITLYWLLRNLKMENIFVPSNLI